MVGLKNSDVFSPQRMTAAHQFVKSCLLIVGASILSVHVSCLKINWRKATLKFLLF